MYIKVKTTSPDLKFRVQGREVSYKKTTLVIYDTVVEGHINDGCLEIIKDEIEEEV